MTNKTETTNVPEQVSAIFEGEGLKLHHTIRESSRYWVGRVKRGDEELILKAVIGDEPWQSPRTRRQFRPSDQLRAEILALHRLSEHGGRLSGVTPQPVASNIGPIPWLLRETVQGLDMARAAGPFLFAPAFYDLVRPADMIDHILSYQALTPELREVVAGSPRSDQTDLQSKMIIAALDNPQGALVPYSPAVNEFLRARISRHNAQINTLAHGECYPPHIFVHNGQICLIDWENVSLNNPLADFVAVWIRTFDNPAWQAEFLAELERRGVFASREMRELWDIEVVYQSGSSLNYLFWSQIETPEQKEPAEAALRRNIENVLLLNKLNQGDT